ncbi:MAG: hypothetical protein IPJ65_29630 [Archangiaceae bacterium]|nr:hypothetical protein [Archangiaceae bacterium]
MAVRPLIPAPPLPTDAAARSRVFHSRDGSVRAAVASKDLWVSPELHFVLQSPKLAEVLTGRADKVDLQLPQWMTQRERQMVAAKLELVVSRTRLLTSQTLSLTFDPADPQKLSLTNESAKSQLSQLRQQLGADAFHAAVPPLDLRGPTEAGRAGGTQTRVLATISYCASSEQVDRFVESLQRNELSFVQYGHTGPEAGMTVVISDDSPEPFASELRAKVTALAAQSPSGARYVVHGDAEKRERFEALWQRVAASPKLGALVDAGLVASPERARALLEQQLSARAGAGTGPNRNSSVLAGLETADALGDAGARGRVFQMDHDMTLEALFEGAQQALRRAGVNSTGDRAPVTGLRQPPPVTLPVDTLGVIDASERQPGAMTPADFTGGGDRSIRDIVTAIPALDQASFFGRGSEIENWFDAPGALSMLHHRPPLASDMPRSAVLMKDFAAPWSTSGRNQDLMFQYFNPRGGLKAATYVLHRDVAGAKWGGRARLLHDDLRSNAAIALLHDLRARARTPWGESDKVDLDAVGREMLKQLSTADVPASVEGSVREAIATAEQFVTRAGRALDSLGQLQRDLESKEPGRAAGAAASWLYGRALERCSRTKRERAESAEGQSAAHARVGEAIALLEAERLEMTARFSLGAPRDALVKEVVDSARQEASALAVSWVFVEEIRGRPPAAR